MGHMKTENHGFTIVELLVVIVVIGILAAITIVSYTGISSKAVAASLQSDLDNNSRLLKMYYVDYGAYPTTMSANCPTLPVNDPKYCLKAGGTNTLTYQPDSTTNVTDFSLYATKNTQNYRITSNSAISNSFSISCPYGFIVVPGSTTYSTSDFCVMKYEAKQVGSSTTPISTASGLPWVNISQTTAIANSPNVAGCTGCHLITEAEWMTIAQNVLSVASNWSGAAVGSGYIYSGHNDAVPENSLAVTALSDGYSDTGNTSGNQKRILSLTNGEVIWDIAGNVWDWTSGTMTGGQPTGMASWNWYQWTAVSGGTFSINPYPSSTVLTGAASWYSANGIGMIYGLTGYASQRGYVRGGYWYSGMGAGVLTLALVNDPSATTNNIGFRISR